MTFSALLKRPGGFVPLLMSAAAFSLILGVLATSGITRQPDEGAPARIFQLLMLLQMPVIAVFALTWVPRSPRNAAFVLALQVAAAVAAIATIAWLERGAA